MARASLPNISMTQSWDGLRKEARRLETEIDVRLLDYSKLVANLQTGTSSRSSSFDNVRNGTEGEL